MVENRSLISPTEIRRELMATKRPRITVKQLYAKIQGVEQLHDTLEPMLEKVLVTYMERLVDIEADLQAGRVKLAHAKVSQLIAAYQEMESQGVIRKDPWGRSFLGKNR
jgi:hypothetical protein